MINKTLKSLSIIFITLIASLLLSGFTHLSRHPNTLHFKGTNNTEITVFTNNQDFISHALTMNPETPNDNIEIGQIIITNGVKEVVFAISEDGSYITIPASE